jgi:hypothetical protein
VFDQVESIEFAQRTPTRVPAIRSPPETKHDA